MEHEDQIEKDRSLEDRCDVTHIVLHAIAKGTQDLEEPGRERDADASRQQAQADRQRNALRSDAHGFFALTRSERIADQGGGSGAQSAAQADDDEIDRERKRERRQRLF